MSDSYQPHPPSGPPPPAPPQPPQKKKRHPVLLGCGGTLALFVIVIIIVAVAANSGGGNKNPQANGGQGHATAAPASTSPTPITKKTSASAPDSVTLRVWGNDGGNGTMISENTDTSNASTTAQISGGSASSPAWSAPLPFNSKQEYYAVTAQMQGTGSIYCSVTIVDNGKTYTKQGSGSGSYEICRAQLNGGIFGGWD